MKISKIAQQFISLKAARKEAKIAEHFMMDGYGDACREIYGMREAIANYAKRNNVRVDVFALEGKNGSMSLETLVRSLDEKNNNRIIKVFDGDVKKIYPKISERTIIIPIKGEDTQIARSIISTTEDTFLRHFLRSIEEMTKGINAPHKIP